jgi:hypothetical protein
MKFANFQTFTDRPNSTRAKDNRPELARTIQGGKFQKITLKFLE